MSQRHLHLARDCEERLAAEEVLTVVDGAIFPPRQPAQHGDAWAIMGEVRTSLLMSFG